LIKIKKFCETYILNIIKSWLIYKAPGLFSILEIKPSSSTIIITCRCNLKCIMCKQWMEVPREELSTDDWKRIIADLKENGINSVHFTGGEPLLRKDLAELISYSFQKGFVVGLTTNGAFLSKKILSDLIGRGLRSIAISIDALNGEYEKIRGVANSFKHIESSAILIAEKRREFKIDAYINFTLMKDNIKELKNVKSFADKIKLPLAICLLDKNSFLFDLEQNRSKFWISAKEDFDALREALIFLRQEKIKNPKSLIINFPAIDFIEDYFRNPRQKQIPCISSQDRIIIDAYGNLLGGCMSMGSFGNIKQKKLRELTMDKQYKLAKRNMFYKNCSGCSCGYLFNIRLYQPRIINNFFQRLKLSWLRNKDG